MYDDTIAQISTPVGEGGISIIKVSGNEAIEKVQKIFQSSKKLKEVQSHTLNYGYIIENEQKIDEVLVGVMHAPKTYTGEDVVEINCHGGILITNKILKLLVQNGIRLAEAGEFTKRAFLNQKKNLAEVETIMDLIHAQNEEALKIAINSLNNNTENLIKDLREKLLQIVTNMEVNIDYPEYNDLEVIENQNIKNEIDQLIVEIQEIIADSKKGEILKTGIETALIGMPNAGKSSLLNYLSKKDKAIVTDIAGTTRDIVESSISLGKISLNLLDTAGIRHTNDEIEKIGVQKSLEQIDTATLILYVIDGSQKLKELDKENLLKISQNNKKYLVIINKTDKENAFDEKEISKLISDEKIVKMSALTKTGEKELIAKIENLFDVQNFDTVNNKNIINIKIALKLEKVYENLVKVKKELEKNQYLDLILIDLKDSVFILSDLLGLEPKEDYLNEIFSRFCLGK